MYRLRWHPSGFIALLLTVIVSANLLSATPDNQQLPQVLSIPPASAAADAGPGSAGANVGPTGAFETEVKIEVPPFRGLEPALALMYDSRGGDGPLGTNWRLAGVSEIRRTSSGKGTPAHAAGDLFILDGEELTPCSGPGVQAAGCRYPPQVAPGTAIVLYTTRRASSRRIAFFPNADGGMWTIWQPNGSTAEYEPHTLKGGGSPSAASWHISRVKDTVGNTVSYNYTDLGGMPDFTADRFLQRVTYNGNEIRLYYEDRPDPHTRTTGRTLVRSAHLVRSLTVRVEGKLARAYGLSYDVPPSTGRSMLASVRQYGTKAAVGADGTLTGASLPALRVTHSAPPATPWAGEATSPVPLSVASPPTAVGVFDALQIGNTAVGGYAGPISQGDIDGDGRTDWIAAGFPGGTPMIRITSATAAGGSQRVRTSDMAFTPLPEWTNPSVLIPINIYSMTADLNGDGRTDVLLGIGYPYEVAVGATGERLAIMPMLSRGDGTFAPGPILKTTVDQQYGLGLRGCSPGDFDGDGRMDVACNFLAKANNVHWWQDSLFTAVSGDDGSFRATTSVLPFHVGGGVRPMTTADANRDGRDDLFFVDYRGEDLDQTQGPNPNAPLRYELVTALSTGGDAATFVHRRTPTEWTYTRNPDGPPDLAASDVNGDGQPDFLVLGRSATGKSIDTVFSGLMEPDGTIIPVTESVPPGLTGGEMMVTVGDTDGDGREDLLVAARAAVHPGDACTPAIAFPHPVLNRVQSVGDGTYFWPTSWTACGTSRRVPARWDAQLRALEVAGADTNGDGLADFLVASGSTPVGTVSLHDDISVSTGADPMRWVPADVDGDGWQDLTHVRVQGAQTYLEVLRREATGYTYSSFQVPPDPRGNGRSVLRGWKLMDVNGDGRSDFVYASCSVIVPSPSGCALEVEAFVSTGTSWRPRRPQHFSWPGADAPSMMAMDVNGDGRDDLVHLTGALRPGGPGTSPGTIRLLLGRSDGGDTGPLTYKLPMFNEPGPAQVPAVKASTVGWRPVDTDGDGKGELIQVTFSDPTLTVSHLSWAGGTTWATTSSEVPATAAEEWDGMSPANTLAWRSLALNADGAMDLVHLAPSSTGVRVHALVNRDPILGPGSWKHVTKDVPVPPTGGTDWNAADANGDSLTDLVAVAQNGPGPGGKGKVRVTTLIADGAGSWTSPPPVELNDSGPSVSASWRSAQPDGDGIQGLVRMGEAPAGAGLVVTSLRPRYVPGLIRTVTSEAGGITHVDYAPSSHFGGNAPQNGCFIPQGYAHQVVTRITVDDGRAIRAAQTDFAYSCPYWSRYHRVFLGYSDVTTTGAEAVNRPKYTQLQRYSRTDTCLTQLETQGFLDQVGAWVGNREIRALNPPGNAPAFDCALTYVNSLTYGLHAGTQNVYTYFSYDEFGNLTSVAEHGASSVTGDERTTDTSYKAATPPWIVAKPWQQTVVNGLAGQPNPVIRRSTFFCYDGDNGTSSSNCSGMPTRGQLTAIQRVDHLGLYVTNKFSYDLHGNVAAATDPRGFGTGIFFDATQHIRPEFVTNALGHTTELQWDKALGQVTKVIDPNGKVTDTRYDEFGRIEATTTPAIGAAVDWTYPDWGDPGKQRIREVVADGSADGLWTETRIDGLGRIYETARESDSGGVPLVQRAEYTDALDAPARTAGWSDPADVRFERFFYDMPGRLVRHEHPDNSFLTHRYDTTPDAARTVVTTRDELQHKKDVHEDAYGRVVEVLELDAPTGQIARVNHEFDAVGDLLSSTDPLGSVTSYGWDPLGHVRTVRDPDLGVRTFDYDPSGNLKKEVDARNRTTSFTYDGLDRPLVKTYPDNSTITWHYDETGHGAGRGQLTSVSDPSGAGCAQGVSESLSYAVNGTISSQTKCVLGRTYTTGTTYDAIGRLKSVTYPDGEQVTYGFGASGSVKSLSGYVDALSYDKAGRLETADLANSTRATYGYDPPRRWLTSQSVTGPGGTVFDAGYAYEPSGVPKSSSSTTNRMNLTYVYDELRRLRTVTGDVPAEFRYDAGGRMLYNSLVGPYSYPAAGPTSCPVGGTPTPCHAPHAPSQAGGTRYQYDANGNQSMATVLATGKSRSIDWTYDSQPAVVQDENGVVTTNTYDHTGTLVARNRNGQNHLRFNDFVEYDNSLGLIKNYLADGSIVARHDGAGLRYLHTDVSGSVRAQTNESGAVVSRQDYTPFGELMPPTLSGVAPGFAGQRTDHDNGLTDMGARAYDPRLGVFTSPDTMIPDPLHPAAQNRFAYAYNDPVSYTDPSGHEPVGIHRYEFSFASETFQVAIRIEALPPLPVLPPLEFYTRPITNLNPTQQTIGPAAPYYPTAEDRQRWADMEALTQEFPGITPAMADLVTSAQQVNRPWKWLNSVGPLAVATATWLRTPPLSARITPSGRVPNIGGGDDKRRGTPYNPAPKKGEKPDNRNCERCVTALIDHIQNKGFVSDYRGYKLERPNQGRYERVLYTVRSNTGVDFGDYRDGLNGRADGHYLLFTRWQDGVPGHVTFSWIKNGKTFFYDPQSGSRDAPTGFFKSVPIIYQK